MHAADKITDHLKARRAIRSDLDAEAARLYKAILRSTKLIVPKPCPGWDRIGGVPINAEFRIGLISRPVSISDEKRQGELLGFSPTVYSNETPMAPYYKLCVADHVDKIVSARATLKKKILRLAKRRANIICVSEIGYPAFLAKGDSKPGSTYQAFLAEGDYEFRLEIQQIADLYSVIIVCGSYHDPREFTNKAVIFFPGFSMPTEHLKMTSAMSIGEVIRTPTANQLPVYQTKLGNIAVLICKDAYDLNILLRYVTMGFHGMNEIRPDLILVPSFSPAPLEAACCDLSYFARCAVAYVNGDVEPHFAVFVGGEAIKVSTSSGVAFVKLNVAERDRMLVEAYEAQQVGVFSSVYGTFVGR